MPSDIDNARAARRAESDFVGVPCGLMDQFIVACAQEGSACLLDCLDETWVEVLADFPDARWAVVYSGIRRELSGGNYASKVRESMAALDRVAEATKLSREDLRILEADALYDACRRSRVHAGAAELLRHFVTENVRVGRMQRALEIGDAETAGGILTEGHWSLSQDFGVSLQSIDAFVRRAEAARGILGVRITGAGFGGSLLALLRGEEAYAGLREAAKVCLPPTHAILDIPGFCGGATGWKR